MQRYEDMKEYNLTGYFSAKELDRIRECMKDKDIFQKSQFVRKAVLTFLDKEGF